jgi:hypothetical protein
VPRLVVALCLLALVAAAALLLGGEGWLRVSVLDPEGKALPEETWLVTESLADTRGLDEEGHVVGGDGRFEARFRAGRHRFHVTLDDGTTVPYGEWTFVEGETRDLVLRPVGR